VVCRCSHFVYSIGHAGVELLGLDQRALRAAWTVFLFALAVALIYIIRGALVTFALAMFLALLLSPVVTMVDHLTSVRVPRTVALTVVYVFLMAVFAAALIGIASAVVTDARALSGRLPETLRSDPLSGLPLPAWLDPMRDRLGIWIRDRLDEFGKNALSLTGEALRQLASGLGAAVSAVLIPILAFFFIKDGKKLRDGFIHSVNPKHQLLVHQILQDLHHLLSQYLRALVILAMVAFTFYAAFLSLTGAPYAILLAGMAGALEFIPAVGPFIAVVIIGAVGLFSGYAHWFLLLLFLVVYRLAQDYILQPLLLGSGMRISPLLVIFGVVAGGEIGGIPGIFFSIPLIATLRLIFLRLWKQDALAKTEDE
jgi:predicted PurR-regulated permease PerM